METAKPKAPNRITIEKAIDLREGEELQSFVKQAIAAVGRVAGTDGKANESLFLRGIFKSTLVAMDFETGKFTQFPFTRDSEGVINLGKGVEVMQVFVPTTQKTEKDAGSETGNIEAMLAVAKSAEIETEQHDVPADQLWDGVIG